MFDRRQKINLACALVCAGMLGFAIFYAEGVLGLQPCPLCMFQRVCIAVLGIVFLFAGLHRVRYGGAIAYAVFIFVAATAATWVAARHVWIQHQPPGTVPAGNCAAFRAKSVKTHCATSSASARSPLTRRRALE